MAHSPKKSSTRKLAPPIEVLANPWLIPASYFSIGFVLWALLVLFFYFQNAAPHIDYLFHIFDDVCGGSIFHHYMAQAVASLAVALWMLWLSFQTGTWLCRMTFAKEDFSKLEEWSLGGAAGLGVMAMGVLFLGALHLWYANVFWSFGALLTGVFIFFKHIPEWEPSAPAAKDRTPWRALWFFVLFFFFVIFILDEFTPEIFYDALYYHIAVPDLYRMAHGIYSLPTQLFSNFVLTIQWIYGVALTLGTEITAKFIHGGMAVMLAFTFLAFEKRFLSQGAGLLAAVLFFAMPLVGMNVGTTGNDIGCSFFQLVAVYVLLRALQNGDRRWLMAAGAFTGLSASCKYPGLPYIPIAALLVLWHGRDQKKSLAETWLALFTFVLPAMALVTPLLVRNILFHHNPLYPFGGTHWGFPKIEPHDWTIFIQDANTRILRNEFQSLTTFFRYLSHPWWITMEGNSNGDFIGPVMLLALPLLFVLRSPSPSYRLLRRYFGLLWLLWMISTKTPRYGLPALALLALLLGEGLIVFSKTSKLRSVIFGAILVGTLSNGAWLITILYSNEGWKVVEGLQTPVEYLSEMHASYPTPPFDGFAWMNSHLPPGSKILLVGDARSYYSRFPVIPSSVPDPQPLVEFSRQARDAADMMRLLREEKVTHIFLNLAEAARTESYGLFHWEKPEWQRFNDFWTHDVQLVWKEERFDPHNPKALYVFELLKDQDAATPHAAPSNPFERWAPK
jgi:4-amino-4-deoxy-L-arabinose transferase-like glycosyltransferase